MTTPQVGRGGAWCGKWWQWAGLGGWGWGGGEEGELSQPLQGENTWRLVIGW